MTDHPTKSDIIRPRHTDTRRLDGGLIIEADVSPCIFMYPGYPLQVRLTLRRDDGAGLGEAHVVERGKTAETATAADFRRLMDAVRIIPCHRCAAPAFDPATIDTNRDGLCEACFLHDLKAEWAAAQEAEREEVADRDRTMKAEGLAFRVAAWIHPAGGGDDYPVHWYFVVRPTPDQIRTLLREEGAAVLDDYRVIAL